MLGVYWLLYKPQSAATERLRAWAEKEALRQPQPVIMPDDRPAAEIAQRLASAVEQTAAAICD
jgi:hypothetical protein